MSDEPTNEQQLVPLLRKLASALWFPMFFIVGFMLCYLLPFHAPQPHDVPVTVVGQQAAVQFETQVGQAMPGGFDVTAVPDEQAARDSITDRDAVAAYDPTSGQLFYGKANGMALMQTLQQVFEPLAQAGGQDLQTVDLAPTAAGDVMGTGLFYLLMAMNIPPYITVMMLLRAEVSTRAKLLSLVGVGAFASVVCYLFGVGLDVVPNQPALMLIGFLLTQAVAWVCFGLVPLVKQFIPGVAMTLFVLLSIPSSGGAIPKHLVPPFFQGLHPYLPLGQTMDAMRGLVYFNGVGMWHGVIVLAVWIAAGVALVSVNHWRAMRNSSEETGAVADSGNYEHEDDGDVVVDPTFEPPRPVRHRSLTGTVVDSGAAPVPAAMVTLTDPAGTQLARIATNARGEYEASDLPAQYVTVVVSASGMRPAVDRISAHSARTVERDFVLDPEPLRATAGAPGR